MNDAIVLILVARHIPECIFDGDDLAHRIVCGKGGARIWINGLGQAFEGIGVDWGPSLRDHWLPVKVFLKLVDESIRSTFQ